MNLDTNQLIGLTDKKAKELFEKNGPNELATKKNRSPIVTFFMQFNDPMIYILFVAMLISALHKEITDVLIILAVMLVNSSIGTWQEVKAQVALDALKKIATPYATVIRNGRKFQIKARELVVGDLVALEAGNIVPADLRLEQTASLLINESALTGESVPVEKMVLAQQPQALAQQNTPLAQQSQALAQQNTPLENQKSMAFSGTAVSYGRGVGVVCATGMNTQIGKIAAIVERERKDKKTPLQVRLNDLSKILGIIVVVLCFGIFLLTVIQHRDIVQMLLVAVSMAVAAVPEGLLAVVTIVLAFGVQKLVKINTIVRRLQSVETLGCVSVICSDKTGTLTQNKMQVSEYYCNGVLVEDFIADAKQTKIFQKDLGFSELVRGFVLCNDATYNEDSKKTIGDPTEIALIDFAIENGLDIKKLNKDFSRVNEKAFDSDRKMMTVVVKNNVKSNIEKNSELNSENIVYTKGALDSILSKTIKIKEHGLIRDITHSDIEKINESAAKMANKALRVLALAVQTQQQNQDSINNLLSENELTFIGLVGMIDPPRPQALNSVRKLKNAGITTIMITGDHKDTAFAIAKKLEIASNKEECITGSEIDRIFNTQNSPQKELAELIKNGVRVFARVSPENKVQIVKTIKFSGQIVAMTGDGVNDAPSLTSADIGISMGITGTDVAKEASDMILIDDNFSTIEKAVEEGRKIYDNIRKSVLFALSSNIGEVLTMLIAIATGLAAPLRAVQILWINLITDSLPCLALGIDTEGEEVMNRTPRKASESLFSRGGYAITVGYGLLIGSLALIAFFVTPISAVGFSFSEIKNYLDSNLQHLQIAQTFAFCTLCLSQLFYGICMRNIKKSVFKINQLTNPLMLFSLFSGIILQIAITEIPIFATWFEVVQLNLVQWLQICCLAVVPIIFHEIKCLFIEKKYA